MLPDCNNSSSLTSSSSFSLRASLSARGAAQARRAQQEVIAQSPPHYHSSSTVLVPTITTTLGRQTGVSVNHGNPSLVDASILQHHHFFLPTRTTPTSFFNLGSSPTTTRRNVLRHGDPRRLPLRTPMNCRREIRNAECIGIIEQALLIAASMDDFCDGDDRMFDEPSVRRF